MIIRRIQQKSSEGSGDELIHTSLEDMENRNKLQNEYMCSIKDEYERFLRSIIPLHLFHYISIFGMALDVYIFCKTERDLQKMQSERILQLCEDELLRLFKKINYFDNFKGEVRIQFDSHENVKKNFKGNYFYRFRE